jgi:hypothetical protein
MRVRFREIDLTNCSAKELSYVSPSQLFFSASREYEVHAISVYDEVTFLLVVDDLNTPSFRPRVAFDTIEAGVPADWICNTFANGPIQLLLGPEFIAKNADAYNAMVDQERVQVEAFWQRIGQRT